MASPSNLTLQQVTDAITALENQLLIDLQNATKTHSSQIPDVQNDYSGLMTLLENARGAVSGSADPGDDWVLWLNGAIGAALKSYAKLINSILGNAADPLGMCTYLGGGPVCMTQAQCSTLPDSSWTEGCS